MDAARLPHDVEAILRSAMTMFRRSRLSTVSLLNDQVLSLLVLFLSIALFSFPLRRRDPQTRQNIHATDGALRALLHFMCPASSIWPASYIDLARHVSRSKPQLFNLSVNSLLCDVFSGKIELRNASEDLPTLFRGRLSLRCYQVKLEVGFGLWSTVMCRLLVSQLSHFFYHPAPLTASLSEQDSIPRLSLPNPDFELTLDGVPSVHIECFIRGLQTTCGENKAIIIHFTTLGPSVGLWTKEFVLCTLPYITQQKRKNAGSRKQTFAPLTIPVHKIVELLTSDNSTFTVVSLLNVSGDYSAHLNARLKDMDAKEDLRKSLIDGLGRDGWRQGKFMLAWEASLYAVNLLTRWAVVLQS